MLQSRGVAESETTEWLNNTPEVMVFEVCLWDVIWSGRDGMGFLKKKKNLFLDALCRVFTMVRGAVSGRVGFLSLQCVGSSIRRLLLF